MTACATVQPPVQWVDSFRDGAPDRIAPIHAPFAMPQPTRPAFPDRTFDIKNYGAVEGGQVKNTDAIRKTIAAAEQAGGGTVLVPEGKWLTGPIHLDDNINLHLAKGAVLLFSQDFADYRPAVFSRHEGIECMKFSPFVYAYGKTNVAVTGEGMLDGQGDPWWFMEGQDIGNPTLRKMAAQGVPVERRIFDGSAGNGTLRPNFFQPINCKNVLVEGVEFRFGAFWTINPVYCENVIVRKVRVHTEDEGRHTPNGDGIDPDSCRNVLIEYCDLDTGDDCIAIKSGKDADGLRVAKPTENVVVRYVRGYRGHGGIVCGSETSGGIRNIYGHHCVFDGTDRGLRFKSGRGRGGGIENVWCSDILMGSVERHAIDLNSLYTSRRLPAAPVDATTPYLRNMHFKNISCKTAKRNMIFISGLPERPIENVYFKNIEVGGEMPIWIADAKRIAFKNLKVKVEKAPVFEVLDSWSLTLENVEAPENLAPVIKIMGKACKEISVIGGNIAKLAHPAAFSDGATSDALEVE
jgi:polygalacturonase